MNEMNKVFRPLLQLIKNCDTIQSVEDCRQSSAYCQFYNLLQHGGEQMAQLNYKTLRQEVADEIRRKILKGEFKAGERIKEHEMAQLLGVSRGPVREALRQLEQEGLVRYERNVGCSVAPMNEKDIYEIGLLRAALEILAVKLCKGKMEPQALQRMRDSVEPDASGRKRPLSSGAAGQQLSLLHR